MIRAKFYKAERTQDGITYTLKGELDKVALHSAVDLQGEECVIKLAEEIKDSDFRETFFYEQEQRIREWGRRQYEMGLQDATQGNLLAEEKGEQK